MTAWLTADPSSLPPDREVTTIAWSTGDSSWGDVYLTVDGEPEVMFAGGPAGTSESPAIAPGHTYVFRLYTVGESRTLLGEAHVRREVRAPTLTANPQVIPAGPGTALTTIDWSTGDGSWGDVYLAIDDEPEVLFAGGSTGSQVIDGIVPGRRYTVRLYETGSTRRLLSAISVSRVTSPPHLTATHNPVPDHWTEPITLKWGTGSHELGQLYLSINGQDATLLSEGPAGVIEGLNIERDVLYLFQLYLGRDRKRRLASLAVSRNDERREALIDLAIVIALSVPTLAALGIATLTFQGVRRLISAGLGRAGKNHHA